MLKYRENEGINWLDNLKLGYGGTKTEMQRLIKDANALKEANGEMADLSIERFGDVVEAIHLIQQQMGITGTTSKEAASTIEGSAGSMRASWENLLVAMADDNKDMGKAVDQFVSSVTTQAKNLVPRIKTVVNGIKKLINSIVTEVFPKLKKEIPQLTPLINVFEWFIKNKSLVVNAIKAIITAFVATKVMTFTAAISKAITSISALATGTTLLTKATSLLNAAWAANPVGLVVAGITTAIGLFSIFASRTRELTEEEKRHKEAIDEISGSLDEYNDKMEQVSNQRQEYLDKNLSEIDYYEDLANELRAITDENGKVKEGYEQRAKFITGELKDALGIEIDYIDGQVTGYKNLEDKIYDVISAKRAQILVEGHEGDYNEAKNQKVKLEEAYEKAIDESNKTEETRDKLLQRVADHFGITKDKLKEFIDEDGKLNTSMAEDGGGLARYLYENGKAGDFTSSSFRKLKKELEDANIAFNESETVLNSSRQAYQNNQKTIDDYENALINLKDKNYEAVLGIYEDTHSYMGKTDQETYDNYQKAITMQEDYLQQLKENKAGYDKDFIDSETKKTQDTINNLKEQQAQYKKVTEDGLKAVNIEWSDSLDDTLSLITGANVQFQEGADGNVQAYVNGVKVGEPTSKKEMSSLVANVLGEITKKKTDANSAGQALLDGVNNGIGNSKKQKNAFSTMSIFGTNLLSTLRRSLQEHSPSKATKEMGEYLLEGLNVGIDSEENKTLKKVSNVGKEVVGALQDELNQNVSLGNITVPSVKSNSAMDSYYNPLINSFKEALKDMKIELDDYEVGKFVDKTVTNAVFN